LPHNLGRPSPDQEFPEIQDSPRNALHSLLFKQEIYKNELNQSDIPHRIWLLTKILSGVLKCQSYKTGLAQTPGKRAESVL
jgi:hypothetical protein